MHYVFGTHTLHRILVWVGASIVLSIVAEGRNSKRGIGDGNKLCVA